MASASTQHLSRPACGHRRHERHRPEETLLYQVFAKHWKEFVERSEQAGGLPRFIVTEVEEYLRCGLLEHDLVRCQCQHCGHEKVCAFSCKRRGFCPSCFLVQEVLPEVAVRHWVCTFPWGVRAVLGYDKDLCREAASAFAKELMCVAPLCGTTRCWLTPVAMR